MSTNFQDLALCEPIQRALRDCAYSTPSPIQEQTIPLVLAGQDVMGCAQTGTGKTATFALPILHHLAKDPQPSGAAAPRVLVIAPTRELASQIQASFVTYGKHLRVRSTVIFGGVGQNPQVTALRRGTDVLVATPGRLLDLMQQKHLSLKKLEVFVIDEADRMLDMGFIHDVRKIIDRLPERRQSLFFSATMPKAIRDLAAAILKDPKHVEVTPPATTVEKIDQSLYHVASGQKRSLLQHLLKEHGDGLALVFSATKRGANRLADELTRAGLPAAAIHGNKSQSARERALEDFRKGRTRILVATDIAARGIDVKGISLVMNFDLPKEPESYVHRIGRTARAGAEGRAMSFCDEKSQGLLRQIEKIIRERIPVEKEHPFHREPQRGDAETAKESRSRSPMPRGKGRGPRSEARGPRPEGRGQQRSGFRGGRSGRQGSRGRRGAAA